MSLTHNRFFKSTLSYLFNASIRANKASKNTLKMGTYAFFCFTLNNLSKGKFYNLY